MSEEKLPLEILREKYLPVEVFPEKYGVSVSKIMQLLRDNKINRAEFNAPGSRKRTLHVNYEEVLNAIEEEKKS